MLPILEKLAVQLDETVDHTLAARARDILDNNKALLRSSPFGSKLGPGLGAGPALLIEDHNWIRLFEQSGDLAYSYRSLLLAGENDQVVVGGGKCPAFEDYCQNTLGLGSPEIMVPAATTTDTALTTRCINDGHLLAQVVKHARKHGELNIIPYMGIEAVWHLASIIAELSGAEVRVAAPEPQLTRCVNDKAWFSQCVEDVLGVSADPESMRIDNLAILTQQISRLARRFSHVAIKLTNSASSAGNLVFAAKSICAMRPQALRDFLSKQLSGIGWRGNFPLLLTAWEEPVACTPSVHLWIPRPEQGKPIVEGIFDQNVIGEISEFNGASPSRLSTDSQQRLANEAIQLGTVFQHLGYFGQCSLDAILIGQDPDTAVLHWVECNGRWGGVSIPLMLANRLIGDWGQRGLVIVEEAHWQCPPCDIDRILSVLADELYIHNQRTDGVILLSPGRIMDGSGYELMILDSSQPLAEQRATRVVRKLRDVMQNGLAP